MGRAPLRGGYRSGRAVAPISGLGISVLSPGRKRTVWWDGCKNRTGIVSLPICNVVLSAPKPDRKPYPKELKTYGDHLRKKRLDLNLSQSQVAKIINVTTDSITNWELNRNEPNLNQIPKIVSFLCYSPIITENPLTKYRLERGLSQKKFAEILEIDPTTLSRLERGTGSRIMNKIKFRIDELLRF